MCIKRWLKHEIMDSEFPCSKYNCIMKFSRTRRLWRIRFPHPSWKCFWNMYQIQFLTWSPSEAQRKTLKRLFSSKNLSFPTPQQGPSGWRVPFWAEELGLCQVCWCSWGRNYSCRGNGSLNEAGVSGMLNLPMGSQQRKSHKRETKCATKKGDETPKDFTVHPLNLCSSDLLNSWRMMERKFELWKNTL